MRLHSVTRSFALSTSALALALAGLVCTGAHAAVVVGGGNLLVNGDFETSNVGYDGYNYVAYAVTPVVSATGWTFAGGSGIANHSGAWGGGAAGSSVAFLQSFPGFDAPTLTQVFRGPYASLDISFSVAQRPGNEESLRVLLDGIDLTPTLLSPAGADWTSYTITAANLMTRSHTLTFVGVNLSNAGDSSLFLDNITVNATVPEPGSLALVGAVLAGLALLHRRRPS